MNAETIEAVVRGFSSAVSPLASELIAADSHQVQAGLRARGNYFPEARSIPLSRYFDPEYAAAEKERLWKKVWQFSVREEDIPNVGDRAPYTVGDLSFVIIRTAPNQFKAFYNTCLHRGTRLCDGVGSGSSIRCPFHAWEWNLDGSLKHIPSRWDFDGVSNEGFRLPEVQTDTWGGFIFINPDPSAPPLRNFLGVLPEHFKPCPAEDRFTAFHIHKKVRANWKVVQEAFLESYHVVETHNDSLPFTGDASTQYDIWNDANGAISRLITPLGIPSPHLGDDASVAVAADYAFEAFALAMPGVPIPKFDAKSSLSGRAQVAEWRRKTMGAGLGRDFSSWSDTEMLDSVQYFMFPNFCPWYAEGLPLVYQFLPYGTDPNESVMCVRLTAPIPGGGVARPPSAQIEYLDFDEPFRSKPGLGLLASIFDQDMSNLPRIQKGLRGASPARAAATLGRYQEQRIQHFHEMLEASLQQR